MMEYWEWVLDDLEKPEKRSYRRADRKEEGKEASRQDAGGLAISGAA